MNELTQFPKCYKMSSKPSKFCPGCGYGIALKELGFVIDNLNLQNNASLFTDIGCNLLAWDFYDLPTIQTHHGRTVATASGFKIAQGKQTVLALIGDGGGYAIGLQNLIYAALRKTPVTIILINNTNYGMTGGQMAPTTLEGQITDTTPEGKNIALTGKTLDGIELLKNLGLEGIYLARGTVEKPQVLQNLFKKALENQIQNSAFSFVEVLSYCPLNWKTDAAGSIERNKKMQEFFKLGEF